MKLWPMIMLECSLLLQVRFVFIVYFVCPILIPYENSFGCKLENVRNVFYRANNLDEYIVKNFCNYCSQEALFKPTNGVSFALRYSFRVSRKHSFVVLQSNSICISNFKSLFNLGICKISKFTLK
jgi:hypothetical protein